jgi:MAF protein
LALTGLGFDVRAGAVEESRGEGETPRQMALRLARAKSAAAAAAEGWVLAADTLVVLDDEVLGKPNDAAGARRMLGALRGRDHRVITAIAVRNTVTGAATVDVCETTVPMRDYSPAEFERYVSQGEPFDKAGGYAIQDAGFNPVAVDRLAGCYANVMGLPLCHLTRSLRRLGAEPPADVPAACMAHTGYDCPVYASILDGRA